MTTPSTRALGPQIHFTKKQRLAIAIALVLWGVETWFLVDAAGYALTPSVAAIPVATAALAFIPLGMEEARSRDVRLAMLLAAIFLSGHVVGSVVERTGGTLDAQMDKASQSQSTRKMLEDELERAQKRLDDALAEVKRESRNGGCRGTCENWQRTARERQARVDELTGELAEAPVVGSPDPVAARLSAITFGRISPATLTLWRPLLLPFGCLLSIWSLLGYGFRGLPTFSAPDFQPAPGKRTMPENVVSISGKHPVIAALERSGGKVSSNRQLARLMQVTDGEASKRWREVENMLEIVRSGRECQISLRRA